MVQLSVQREGANEAFHRAALCILVERWSPWTWAARPRDVGAACETAGIARSTCLPGRYAPPVWQFGARGKSGVAPGTTAWPSVRNPRLSDFRLDTRLHP
jgi:hypothetical protein